MPPPPPLLRVLNLGARLVPYGLATQLQDVLATARRGGQGVDTVLVLQVRKKRGDVFFSVVETKT